VAVGIDDAHGKTPRGLLSLTIITEYSDRQFTEKKSSHKCARRVDGALRRGNSA
jgi:hypothetical protein